MMKSNTIQRILDQIPPERKEELRKEQEAFMLREQQLFDEGYRYGTDKSYSLVLLREKGFTPIGICYHFGEETFIFKTKKEAELAWKSRILGYDGWWYSKRDFYKEVKDNLKVIWL